MDCSCKSDDLFYYGCRCGAFQREIRKHLWFNGRIYVVARTEEHAVNLAVTELSTHPDFDLDWIKGDESGWRQLPDDEIITLSFSDLTQETLTAGDWAEMYEQGYLAAA